MLVNAGKLQVLTCCLSAELRRALQSCGMADDVAAPILEMVQAEADQLRLKLDGGNHLANIPGREHDLSNSTRRRFVGAAAIS